MSVNSVGTNPLLASLLAGLTSSQNAGTPTAYPATASDASSQTAPALTGSSEASLSDEIIGALVMMQAQGGTAQSGTGANPIAQAFAGIDANGDGSISQSELENAIEGAGGTAAEADQVYAALGGTSTTGISQSAFGSAAQSGLSALSQTATVQGTHGHHHHHHHHGAGSASEADQIFSAIDSNGDGSISPDELSAALGTGSTSGASPSSSGTNSLFAAIDTNGDGSISQSELSTYLNSLQSQIQSDQSTLGSFMRLANNAYQAAPAAQSTTQNVTA